MNITQHNDGTLEIDIPTEKGDKSITTTQADLELIAQALTESLDNEIEITTSNLWHYSPFVHTQLSNGEKLITYRIEDEPENTTTFSIEPEDETATTQWDLHLSEETARKLITLALENTTNLSLIHI